ncbi:TY-Chap domain-containing protein [Nocardia sp. NBC_01327]|uniref:TY-Chap domain-containing protein n=1 Tax=Nocardia sp. NBC_01327 TaxID=2903593 RepID=UPI002E10C2F6|nr:hypothetical protein OG326_30805 [Nocardia sp. NBC_01327]
MSENIDLRLTIRFDGDEALARAVLAAVDAVLLHERVYYEVPTYCEAFDDGIFVVRGETDPAPMSITRWYKWGPRFEAQIEHSVAELVPDARVTIDWGLPDQDWELPDPARDLGDGRRLQPELAAPPVDWPDLADRLARVLAGMPADGYLTLRATDDRYAQIVHWPGEIYCEVASNRTLDPRHRMSEEQEALMSAHGWSEPPGNGTENWAKELHPPLTSSDYTELTEDVVWALSGALAIAAPIDLEVQAWRDGLSQAFAVDALGLNRLPRPCRSRVFADAPPRKQSKLSAIATRYLRRNSVRRK